MAERFPGAASTFRDHSNKHALFALLRAKQTGFGIVLAAGPDAKDIKVGDKVLFGDSIGQEFTHEHHQYLVMREEHVLGVME